MHDSIRYRMHDSLSDNQFRTLFLTADAVDTLSADAGLSPLDSVCRRLSMRQEMHGAFFQIANVGVCISDSGYRIHSITKRMQKTLIQIAEGGVSLSDSGFRRHSMTQRMQDYIRQHIQETCYAVVSLSDSGYRRHSFRQRIRRHSMIQGTQVFHYLIADADDTHSEGSIKVDA